MWTSCDTPADLEALLAASQQHPIALFKHSTRCPISAAAQAHVERFLLAHPAALCARVLVVEQRPLSLHIATRITLAHQSPQFIIILQGQVAWSASHQAIMTASVTHAWTQADSQ
jgi:bacillithiol system protein YtxJ